MSMLVSDAPWLMVMLILLGGSAFFAAAEAALFSLPRSRAREKPPRRTPATPAERTVATLLSDPQRLLTAVLLWNQLVNLLYFALASVIVVHWQQGGRAAWAGAFTLAALLAIIVFGEMLPKSLAVLRPRRVALWVAAPLAAAIRAVGLLLPALQLVKLLSQRLFCPRFRAEPYLQIRDLERAVHLSMTEATLVQREQRVLESIVLLSEIRVDELMRPRTEFLSFRPPVSPADLRTRMPSSGYLLVTEPDSDEVAAAIALDELYDVPAENLDRRAGPVLYAPWCTPVAEALEMMRRQGQAVLAVVNEYGETVGILTFDDILDTIFSGAPSRSERLLRRAPIRQVAPGTWHVTGMASLRRLARYFHMQRPPSKSITVAGVVQEMLERIPLSGDQCRWGPFRFKVLDVPRRGQLLVELTMARAEDTPP